MSPDQSAPEDHSIPEIDVPALIDLWHQHAEQIRRALFRIVLTTVGLSFPLFEVSTTFMGWLEAPLLRVVPGLENIYFTGIADKFVVYLKATLLASVLVSAPYWLWELGRLVTAFAPRATKVTRTLAIFSFFALLALYAGIVFGYFVLLPVGMDYLLGFATDTERPIITLTRYYRFVLQTLSAAAILFEVPVVVLFLGRLGLVRSTYLSERRRWMIFLSTLLAFVLAPSPDSLSFLAVLGPLYVLFELSIQGLRWMERGRG